MVKNSLIVVTTTLLDKGNLVAYAELNKLTYMHVGLGSGLQIDIIEDAILKTKANVVECLVYAHFGRFIE